MTTNLLLGAMSVLVVLIVGYISYRQNLLDFQGFTAATVIGCIIIFLGGIQWFILLASFLIFANITTKYKYEQKNQFQSVQAKQSVRGWQNVVANGGTAIISSLGYSFTNSVAFEVMFLGAISTAAADTIATELGLLSENEPHLITSLRQRVKRGISGGVSLLGETASLLGSVLIAIVASMLGFGGLSNLQLWGISIISGFFGSTFDSLLGATLQSQYECSICTKVTEKRIHCNCPANLTKGYSFIDNNLVNLGSTAFGAVVAWGVLVLGI